MISYFKQLSKEEMEVEHYLYSSTLIYNTSTLKELKDGVYLICQNLKHSFIRSDKCYSSC